MKLFLAFLLALTFTNSGFAATTVVNEPESFTWTAVSTDIDGDPVDLARITGYTANCTSQVGHAPVTLNFPGQATESAPIAPGTFDVGTWDCTLAADDTEAGTAGPPATAAATFEVTLVVTLSPLAAPATYEVTFTATPQ